jgi:hypothetical protein
MSLLHGSVDDHEQIAGSANNAFILLFISSANSSSSNNNNKQQTTMAPRVPKIGKGVKVVTKKKPVRHGTVVAAVGPRTWTVKFAAEDGGVKTEQLSSAQLGVYKEYYNKHSSTPV